ncbi:3-oxoacyl-[acyl-carrier-protein] synthase III C-terminal domain-containing protein [Paenibacillus agilis]|nr:3-oxoacyl-[acyl-carrier-protein] synthase III C-terminal domain-containing protein [Paenibacillus agilis]
MTTETVHISAWSLYQPDNEPIRNVIQEAKREGYVFTRDEAEFNQEGIYTVAMEKHLTHLQMIERVVEPLIEKCRKKGTTIAEIWFAQTSMVAWHDRNFFKSALARWGLEHVPIYALEEYSCSSFHSVLKNAKIMLEHAPNEAILFIGCDKGRHPLDYVTDYVFVGDSSSACILEYGKGAHQLLAVDSKHDKVIYDNDEEKIKQAYQLYYLHIRQFVIRMIKQNGLKVEDIKLVFCNNMPNFVWETVARTTGIPLSKFYRPSLHTGCHMTNSDVLFNLEHAVMHEALAPGDYYFSLTTGTGGSFGCALHRYCPPNHTDQNQGDY